MIHIDDSTLERVRRDVAQLYQSKNLDLPFHGWHHVTFVTAKSLLFARELGANERIVEVAALVHDLNYLVDPTTSATAGASLRQRVLAQAGLTPDAVAAVERVVLEAETVSRGAHISTEARALSDADTLFKALPFTPVILAPLYMRETGRTLRDLAEKIVREQIPLETDEIYFYSESARAKYRTWGEANLQLWRCILDSLDDPDVVALLKEVPRL